MIDENYTLDRQTDRLFNIDLNRVGWIDVAKGIAIVLVIIGHTIMGPLSRPRSKILRVAVSRIILSSEASKVKLVGNLVA
jgi:uncharacterized membrane protein YcfT